MTLTLSPRQQQFRDAMTQVAYSVSVVTTDGIAGRDGVTVTAMLPVSDAGEEPVILVCIRATSRALPVILGNGAFCVNILGEEHSELADRFAGRQHGSRDDWFGDAGWHASDAGSSPMLEGAIAAFHCRIISDSTVASHRVLFGAVSDIRSRADGSPLLHARRLYQRLGPPVPPILTLDRDNAKP